MGEILYALLITFAIGSFVAVAIWLWWQRQMARIEREAQETPTPEPDWLECYFCGGIYHRADLERLCCPICGNDHLVALTPEEAAELR